MNDMDEVESRDGTSIAFWRSGSGPPLLLIHGATADHSTTWRLVLPELERRFTTYVMDRRGRGGSGDSAPYHLQREAEDVAAVVERIGQQVDVLGHSFGALCAIEAALITTNVRRLILYEGVYIRGDEVYPPGLIERLQGMLDAGDVGEMLTAMFRELVGMPEDEIEMLRSQREAWEKRLRNAHTLPRELRADAGYAFAASRFRAMRNPTLLLVGGASPAREMKDAEAIAGALPDGRVVILAGQQHLAMYTAPKLFVDEVAGFLE